MRYELVLEIHRNDAEEVIAIARELSRDHATVVTVYAVESGKTFAESDRREVIKTVEPA